MRNLTTKDYQTILNYYKISLPKNKINRKQNTKKLAEKIISKKLCKCIKKLDKGNEGKAIGICTRTIINRKGFSRGNFKCKKNLTIKLFKRSK